MAKNLQTFAQKVYTRISVRYTAVNLQLPLRMGLINLIKNLGANMFRKNNTITDIEPDPTPHPCGNWSTLDCHMLARGYNTLFWDDPYKDDVSNNSTLPCSPEDCNNTGFDRASLTPSYYVIIGLGGLLAVAAIVVVYRKIRGATHNSYNQFSEDTSTPLTVEWLKIHDQESQRLEREESTTYNTNSVVNGLYQAIGPSQTPTGLQAHPSNASPGSNASSDLLNAGLDIHRYPAHDHLSSGEESEGGKSMRHNSLNDSPSKGSYRSNASSDGRNPNLYIHSYPTHGSISSDDESNPSDDDRYSDYSRSSNSP